MQLVEDMRNMRANGKSLDRNSAKKIKKKYILFLQVQRLANKQST